MSDTDNHIEEESELIFGTRTIFVPGRSIEIGYSVRKKSSFPILEEFLLKFLNAVGSASLSDIVGFLDLPSKYLTVVFQPLLSKGLIIQYGDDFQLSVMGKMLFSRSENGTPTLTESESRINSFTINDECALPTVAADFREHRETAKGNLRLFIDDLRQTPVARGELLGRVRRNFGKHFALFMRNERDLEKFREEQLDLHKIEYAKTKKSFPIQVDIHGVIQRTGVVVNRVFPFDMTQARTDEGMEMRSALVEAAKIKQESGSIDEVRFLQNFFGKDFFHDPAILSLIETTGVLQWFKILPKFFIKNGGTLQSGDQMVIGEACLTRNIESIKTTLEQTISNRSFTQESPLKIVWLRPSVDSWGRSIAFLDAIKKLRGIVSDFSGLSKRDVKFELWENRYVSNNKIEERLKAYWPWFDDVRFFRSNEVPSKMEMIIVDNNGGIAVTHAFTPPQACFPCPIGVAFKSNEMIQKLVMEKITPELRSLPKFAKKTKKSSKK
jgi:hypothetical protein